MEYIIHENKYYWGTVYHIISNDGKAHIACDIRDDGYLNIFELFIWPELRGNKLGLELLKQAEQIGIDNNMIEAGLAVENIDKLINYYKEAGYKQFDKDKHYIYMKKKLIKNKHYRS